MRLAVKFSDKLFRCHLLELNVMLICSLQVHFQVQKWLSGTDWDIFMIRH